MALLRPSLEDAGVRRARTSTGSRTAGPWRSPGWSSHASGRRPRAASSSCCSRTSWGRSTSWSRRPSTRRHRLAVRTASFAQVSGKLERRAGVVNVVASALRPIATPDQPRADVRHIEPPAERETGRRIAGGDADRAGALSAGQAAELAAVMPAAHSFGRPRAMTRLQVPIAEHMFRPAALLPCASCPTGVSTSAGGLSSAASISRSTSRRWASMASCRPPRTGPVVSEPTGGPESIAGLAGRR